MEEEGREDDSAMDIDTMDGWYAGEEQEEEDAMPQANAEAPAEAQTVEAPF